MLALALVALPQLAASDPAPEPTPRETLALELINRMRSDPAAEAQRLSKNFPREPYEGFDVAMFVAEMEELEPQPPLVMHPRLIAAARNHAEYTARHQEYGHGETAGRAGFSGASGSERAAFAGYPEGHGSVLENAGSFLHGGVAGAHWASAVDDGPGGPGGMQARRGHRRTILWPRGREFGMGFHFHADGRCEKSALFGEGAGHRLVGGVAYVDLDGDGAYSLGEGLGGVRIELGKQLWVHTWGSGAYALDPGGSSSGGVWTARLYDLVLERKYKGGTDNLKLDAEWLAPIRERLGLLLKTHAGGSGTRATRAAWDLAFWTAALPSPVPGIELPAEAEALRAPWHEARARWLESLRSASGSLGMADVSPPRGTLALAWLEQAQQLAALQAELAEIEASQDSARTTARKLAKLAKTTEASEETVTMPALRPFLAGLRQRVASRD